MFPEERRAQVARIIDETGRVTVSELARRFGVTEDLMRRDLKQLAEEGRCQKVYGGATRVENVRERPMSARIDQHAGEKLAIARKALPLVGPGQTVYLDMSSTCVQLARLIASSGVGCTVVTPMVDVLVRRRRRRAQGRRHGEGEPGVPAVRVRQVQCVRHVPLREPRRLRRTRL